MDGQPRTATSTLTQLLNYDIRILRPVFIYRELVVDGLVGGEEVLEFAQLYEGGQPRDVVGLVL